MSHTQEMLKYFLTETGLCRINPVNGGLIVAECSVRNPFDVEQTANARRLVACWNLLASFSTEQIEKGVDISTVVLQRDELLEALEIMLESIEEHPCHIENEEEAELEGGDVAFVSHLGRVAREAKAKVKGEKL